MRLNSNRFINNNSLKSIPQEGKPPNNEIAASFQSIFPFVQMISINEFDGGNMLKAERDYSSQGNQFNVTICPDAYLTSKEMKYRTWFYFSVQGVPRNNLISITIKNTNFQVYQSLTLSINYERYLQQTSLSLSTLITLNHQSIPNQQKLYREGHQPVYKSSITNQWLRVTSNVANTIVQHDTGIDLTFSHTFSDSEELVYFAFTYPWSYTDNQELLDLLENKFYNDKDLYFHRTTLVKSREFRNVELLTISSHGNRLKDKMALPSSSTFPLHNPPDLFAEKKYIFISTRVHPGEVPGSHVFNGMLSLLLEKDDLRAKTLRDQFVFVMVPLLNPDGVSRGHYRTDAAGQNLNRFYISPSQNEQPEIYGVKELLMFLHGRGQLFAYLDLHAHATKKGSFIYGNCMDYRNQIDSNLLTKLMALNSPFFEYEQCNFSERNMYAKDKSDGLSKEGSGRVALYKQTNIPLCFTLECNYNMPCLTNTLYARAENYTFENPSIEMQEVTAQVVLQAVNYEQTPATQPYLPSHYSQLGEGMLEAFLDFTKKNPISRISNSPYKNLINLRMQIAYQTMRQIPYRFENYLRNVVRAIHGVPENNCLPQLRILYNYMTKGTKSPQLMDKENQNVRTAPRKSQIMQDDQPKRKSIIPQVMSFPSKPIDRSDQSGVVQHELKIEPKLPSKLQMFPSSNKNSNNKPRSSAIEIGNASSNQANIPKYRDSKDAINASNIRRFDRDAKSPPKSSIDLIASRPSYKSIQKRGSESENLKINKIIEQAKLETSTRKSGSSVGKSSHTLKQIGSLFVSQKQ